MAIDDAVQAARLLSKAKKAEKALDVTYEGIKYKFPPGTTKDEAERWIWNHVVRAKATGKEEKITFPSELPKERQEILETEANPPTADIIPFKPVIKQVNEGLMEVGESKKLEPGIYVDEDSGKYYRITKDGDMEPLE